jgi:hypothetical protein
MGTVTASIHAGAPHPNDDGLTWMSMSSVWLTENSRPHWASAGSARHTASAIWRPARPASILRTGLCFAAAENLKLHRNADGRLHELLTEPSVDFHSLAEPELEEALWRLVRQTAATNMCKVIVCSFMGSAVSRQLDCLDELDCDIEVLRPTDTRLYCRWQERVNTTGRFGATAGS